MSVPAADYQYVDVPSQHTLRRRAIVEAHPEVRDLMGSNALSGLWIVLLVITQWAIAWAVTGWQWWWIALLAYGVGAFFNHALYVMIHECTHNLAARTASANKLLGILCDFALALPGALAFRKYHLYHHRYLGRYDLDPDIVSRTEAGLVGHGPLRKAVWVFFLGISQALRPMKLKSTHGVSLLDRWVLANTIAVVVVDVALLLWIGPLALLYLILSTVFALGLHPLGGRWIQEHYLTREGQETYSYYGPLNRLCFNMGFHNEHHDFPNVPWNHLPRLRRLADEHYAHLKSYRSWLGVLVKFIFDPSMSGYSRMVRVPSDERAPVREPKIVPPRPTSGVTAA